jgi:hypothetical protein
VWSFVIELRSMFNGARFRKLNEGLKQVDERSETVTTPFEQRRKLKNW